MWLRVAKGADQKAHDEYKTPSGTRALGDQQTTDDAADTAHAAV
jgi:hypothetical protein